MLSGGCQCGAIRYEVRSAPVGLYVCHCTECRKQSASAFGISVIVPAEALTVTRGSPSTWSRATDRGTGLDCFFCPDCGSRLWHAPDPAKGTVSVKGGSLDTPVDLGDAVHIWTASRLPGVAIPPGARSFPGEPE
ncbi:MAG: GFA family protein [Roseovarius sp.]|uniref:GFA family protein n=1 Tax=Roseovarius sp. TaxID=1486281 RepID=UPI0032EB1F46